MIADAVLDVTARRDLVLDAFLGSRSALIAAERMSRHCRGIEMDPPYAGLTIRRRRRLTGQAARRQAEVAWAQDVLGAHPAKIAPYEALGGNA